MCGKVRAQQLAVAERREAGRRIGEPARAHEGTIAAESQRVGQTEEGSEGEAEDALRIVELPLLQRADRSIHGQDLAPASLPAISATWRPWKRAMSSSFSVGCR